MSSMQALETSGSGLDLESWLRPISENNPAGANLRYEPLYAEIRYAREEDDPNLPMGQWERPLKSADWVVIERRCTEALQATSKDFQLVAWLTEAWLRTNGLEGLGHGLMLTHAFVKRYWQEGFPLIDDGDADARIAVFEWMNDNLTDALKRHVPLLRLVDHKPSTITLAQWEELVRVELDAADTSTANDTGSDAPVLFTRASVLKNVRRHSLQDVATMLSTVRECKPILQEIDSLIYALQGSNSPSWQKLSKVLENFEYVFMSISPDALSAEQAPSAGIAPGQPLSNTAKLENTGMDQALEDIQYTAGVWSSREQAYKTLEQLAEYLATIEPHSPTPYLIRRAVKWGQLPLAELIQEVLNEEGDLNGMLAMMGLQR